MGIPVYIQIKKPEGITKKVDDSSAARSNQLISRLRGFRRGGQESLLEQIFEGSAISFRNVFEEMPWNSLGLQNMENEEQQ